MQVVILCGGQGTRIRDVAENIPKPMIPIGGRPILWHIMQSYAAHGFRRFILCLGFRSWAIKEYFLNYRLTEGDFTLCPGRPDSLRMHSVPELSDWEVTLVETGRDTMTGGRLKAASRYIQGDRFMLTYGDGVSDVNLVELLAHHRRQGRIGTVTAVRAPGRFGEMELVDNQVSHFCEKPPVAPGWISGGYFVFEREFLNRLSNAADLVLEQGPLRELAEEGELSAYCHEGFWRCMDNSRDYEHLNQLFNENRAAWIRREPWELCRAS